VPFSFAKVDATDKNVHARFWVAQRFSAAVGDLKSQRL
jgi:hypothetical protein